MKKIFFSLIAGILLLGAPVISHASTYYFEGPCKTFSFTCIEPDMTKYNFTDPYPLATNNAYVEYDDSTGQFWGEIDMPNTTIYFSPHDSTGAFVTNYSKAAANCDVWFQQYLGGTVYGYPGSAEVEAAISATGKAAVKVNITGSEAYWTDYTDWFYNGWYYTYQGSEVLQKAKLPTFKLQLY